MDMLFSRITGPFQLVCRLHRSCAHLTTLPVNLFSCRYVHNDNNKPRRGQKYERDYMRPKQTFGYEDVPDGELELQNVEDKIQDLIDKTRRAEKAVKYHIIKRKMSPPGPPERRLTWQAIEQIRYLKNEMPEEWTVERLAEGFSVTPDVILRVLKNKFIPSPDRKCKQDAKVLSRIGQQVLPAADGTLQDHLKLTSSFPKGGRNALVAATGQGQLVQIEEQSRSVVPSPAPANALSPRFKTAVTGGTVTAVSKSEKIKSSNHSDDNEEIWKEQELTELKHFQDILDNPPSVVQVGREFFDEQGNFLYRVQEH